MAQGPMSSILVTIRINVQYARASYSHRPDPGVRSPKSGFTGLSNYQRFLMKFYGELGCDLETN